MKKRKVKEVADKVRCNNCMGIFDENINVCPKCGTDAYLMQPFVDEARSQHTPGSLSFDGFGINLGDEYKSRLCTFTRLNTATGVNEKDAEYYGPLFAAAPELLQALKELVAEFLPKTGKWDSEHGECMRSLIAKAEGKI